MIPIRDVIPSRTAPVVAIGLIAVNALIFLYGLFGGDRVDDFVIDWALVPAAFSWGDVLTSMLVHRRFGPFAGNMLALWIFGNTLEDRMGHGRFLAFYLTCGIAAALAQAFMTPASHAPMFGAGGAIAGVLGAYFVLYPQSRILTLVPWFPIQLIETPAILLLALWFVLQLLSGGIGIAAQLVGLVTGMGTVGLFRRPERLRVEWWSRP